MRALIARDLADAALAGLSTDRRFATAYNAALRAANMAIACAGYRITARTGHHRISLEAAGFVIGKPAAPLMDYFDLCRRKRNLIDYTRTQVASETEAQEIVLRRANCTSSSKPGLLPTTKRWRADSLAYALLAAVCARKLALPAISTRFLPLFFAAYNARSAA